jgi:hypothetical protein
LSRIRAVRFRGDHREPSAGIRELGSHRRVYMSLQAEEQVPKRRLMEQVPQEPITADPREDDEEDEDVPEEDEERGGEARRVGQRAELGGGRR